MSGFPFRAWVPVRGNASLIAKRGTGQILYLFQHLVDLVSQFSNLILFTDLNAVVKVVVGTLFNKINDFLYTPLYQQPSREKQ